MEIKRKRKLKKEVRKKEKKKERTVGGKEAKKKKTDVIDIQERYKIYWANISHFLICCQMY